MLIPELVCLSLHPGMWAWYFFVIVVPLLSCTADLAFVWGGRHQIQVDTRACTPTRTPTRTHAQVGLDLIQNEAVYSRTQAMGRALTCVVPLRDQFESNKRIFQRLNRMTHCFRGVLAGYT